MESPDPVTFRGHQEGGPGRGRELRLSQNKASSQAVMGDQASQAELARPEAGSGGWGALLREGCAVPTVWLGHKTVSSSGCLT